MFFFNRGIQAELFYFIFSALFGQNWLRIKIQLILDEQTFQVWKSEPYNDNDWIL